MDAKLELLLRISLCLSLTIFVLSFLLFVLLPNKKRLKPYIVVIYLIAGFISAYILIVFVSANIPFINKH